MCFCFNGQSLTDSRWMKLKDGWINELVISQFDLSNAGACFSVSDACKWNMKRNHFSGWQQKDNVFRFFHTGTRLKERRRRLGSGSRLESLAQIRLLVMHQDPKQKQKPLSYWRLGPLWTWLTFSCSVNKLLSAIFFLCVEDKKGCSRYWAPRRLSLLENVGLTSSLSFRIGVWRSQSVCQTLVGFMVTSNFSIFFSFMMTPKRF